MRALLAGVLLATAPSPTALLSKLVTTPFGAGELPAGVTASPPARVALTTNGRTYRALGEVEVLLKGPDADDEIVYEVFPDAKHALADLKHPALTKGAHVVGAVPGIAHSVVVEATLTGKNAAGATVTAGFTDYVAVSGNVLVQALTYSTTNKAHGNRKMALALLRAGLAHLRGLGGPSA